MPSPDLPPDEILWEMVETAHYQYLCVPAADVCLDTIKIEGAALREMLQAWRRGEWEQYKKAMKGDA